MHPRNPVLQKRGGIRDSCSSIEMSHIEKTGQTRMDLQMKKYKKALMNGGLFVSIRGACDESLSRQSLGGCDSCGCMLPHVSTSAVHLRHIHQVHYPLNHQPVHLRHKYVVR